MRQDEYKQGMEAIAYGTFRSVQRQIVITVSPKPYRKRSPYHWYCIAAYGKSTREVALNRLGVLEKEGRSLTPLQNPLEGASKHFG